MKLQLFLIFFIISNISSALVTAEKPDTLLKKKENEEYIAKYSKKTALRPFFQQQTMSLEFQDKNKSGLPLIYNPNAMLYAGIDMNFRVLGLSVLFKIPPDESLVKRFGETKFINLKLGFHTSHISFETYFQRYTGFYLFNAVKIFNATGQNQNNGFQDSLPQMPDLRVTTLGMNLCLQWSGKMSLSAAFNQTKRQLKNAGSFLLLLSGQYTGISNNDTLVPRVALNELQNLARYRSGVYNTFSFMPGYGYTLVLNRQFFLTLLGFAGAGLQQQYNEYHDDKEFKIKGTYKLSIKGSAGYNSDIFFAGLSAGLDVNTYNLETIRIRVIPMFWKFGAGVRF